jgi:hypothetical protein
MPAYVTAYATVLEHQHIPAYEWYFSYAGIRYSTIRNSVTGPYLTGCWSLLKLIGTQMWVIFCNLLCLYFLILRCNYVIMTWKVVISRSNKIYFICPRSTLLQSWNNYIGTSWKRLLLEKKVEYFGLTLLPPPSPPQYNVGSRTYYIHKYFTTFCDDKCPDEQTL